MGLSPYDQMLANEWEQHVADEDAGDDEPTTEETFALDIADILHNCNTAIGLDREIIRIGTFAESGIGPNHGVIVCLNDGTEYQLTVVRRR